MLKKVPGTLFSRSPGSQAAVNVDLQLPDSVHGFPTDNNDQPLWAAVFNVFEGALPRRSKCRHVIFVGIQLVLVEQCAIDRLDLDIEPIGVREGLLRQWLGLYLFCHWRKHAQRGDSLASDYSPINTRNIGPKGSMVPGTFVQVPGTLCSGRTAAGRCFFVFTRFS